MRTVPHLCLLLALALWTTGCPPPGGRDGGPPCDPEARWGPWTDADFVGFDNGDLAELTRGFQGFLYVDSMVSVGETGADRVELSFQVTVDGQETRVQQAGEFSLELRADGQRVARDVLVFFNDVPLPLLLGRKVEVITVARSGRCEGVSTVEVTLVDSADCLELADGGLDCGACSGGSDGGPDGGCADGGP